MIYRFKYRIALRFVYGSRTLCFLMSHIITNGEISDKTSRKTARTLATIFTNKNSSLQKFRGLFSATKRTMVRFQTKVLENRYTRTKDLYVNLYSIRFLRKMHSHFFVPRPQLKNKMSDFR